MGGQYVTPHKKDYFRQVQNNLFSEVAQRLC